MNKWYFHGIALKTDNKKFTCIEYKPSILLANELATNSAHFSPSPWRMAVGHRDAAFDLGIKQLLCDDNEDDESLWAYFSELGDAKQPPLTLWCTALYMTWILMWWTQLIRISHMTNTTDMGKYCVSTRPPYVCIIGQSSICDKSQYTISHCQVHHTLSYNCTCVCL